MHIMYLETTIPMQDYFNIFEKITYVKLKLKFELENNSYSRNLNLEFLLQESLDSIFQLEKSKQVQWHEASERCAY